MRAMIRQKGKLVFWIALTWAWLVALMGAGDYTALLYLSQNLMGCLYCIVIGNFLLPIILFGSIESHFAPPRRYYM